MAEQLRLNFEPANELAAEPAAETTVEARLEPLVEQRQRLVEERNKIERLITEASDEISSILLEAGRDRATVGEFSVTFTLRTRTSLDKFKLLEAGVPLATIKAAEKTSTYTVLEVRKAGK